MSKFFTGYKGDSGHFSSSKWVFPIVRSHLKIRIFVRDQGEAEDQTAGILKHVEDLRRRLNADIGRKDFFEMASTYRFDASA